MNSPLPLVPVSTSTTSPLSPLTPPHPHAADLLVSYYRAQSRKSRPKPAPTSALEPLIADGFLVDELSQSSDDHLARWLHGGAFDSSHGFIDMATLSSKSTTPGIGGGMNADFELFPSSNDSGLWDQQELAAAYGASRPPMAPMRTSSYSQYSPAMQSAFNTGSNSGGRGRPGHALQKRPSFLPAMDSEVPDLVPDEGGDDERYDDEDVERFLPFVGMGPSASASPSRGERSYSLPPPSHPKPPRRRTLEHGHLPSLYPAVRSGTDSGSGSTEDSPFLPPPLPSAGTVLATSPTSFTSPPLLPFSSAPALGAGAGGLAYWNPATDHPLTLPEEEDTLLRLRQGLVGVDLGLFQQQQQLQQLQPGQPRPFATGSSHLPSPRQLASLNGRAQLHQPQPRQETMFKRPIQDDVEMRRTVSPQETFLDYKRDPDALDGPSLFGPVGGAAASPAGARQQQQRPSPRSMNPYGAASTGKPLLGRGGEGLVPPEAGKNGPRFTTPLNAVDWDDDDAYDEDDSPELSSGADKSPFKNMQPPVSRPESRDQPMRNAPVTGSRLQQMVKAESEEDSTSSEDGQDAALLALATDAAPVVVERGRQPAPSSAPRHKRHASTPPREGLRTTEIVAQASKRAGTASPEPAHRRAAKEQAEKEELEREQERLKQEAEELEQLHEEQAREKAKDKGPPPAPPAQKSSPAKKTTRKKPAGGKKGKREKSYDSEEDAEGSPEEGLPLPASAVASSSKAGTKRSRAEDEDAEGEEYDEDAEGEEIDDDDDDFELYNSGSARRGTGSRGRGHQVASNATGMKPPNKRRRRVPVTAAGTAPATGSEGGIVCDHRFEDGSRCAVIFRRPYDLARHKETIHGVGGGSKAKKDWACAECGGTFSRKDALIRHGRTRNHDAGV